MKSKLSSVLFSTLLAASALLAVQVRAEPGAGGPPPGEGAGGEHKKGGEKGKMPSPADRIAKMKENLGLSDDQATKIKAILESEAKEGQELRKDDSIPMEQKKEKMKAIREKNKAAIDAILTPEQRAKADAARAKMGGQGGKKGEGKGPKGDMPPPPKSE
jgi:Spy/CpxP family protein refolding chaperone